MATSTDKQRATRARNWKVFQLRGLYHTVNFRMFSEARLAKVLQLIDEELTDLGAESEASRTTQRRLELFKEP